MAFIFKALENIEGFEERKDVRKLSFVGQSEPKGTYSLLGPTNDILDLDMSLVP